MRLADFRDALRNQDEYHTPEHPRRPWSTHVPGLTEARLYGRFAVEICNCSSQFCLGTWNDDKLVFASLRCMRAVERAGGRLHITGLRNMAALEGGAVVAANHMTTLDTIIMPGFCNLFKPMKILLKESLVTIPIFGGVARSLRPIPVSRTNPRADFKLVMDEGLDVLAKGWFVMMFPGSTRTLDFAPAKFSSIGAKLAKKASTPIVPVALKTDLWGTSKVWKDFGPANLDNEMKVSFGPPVTVTNEKDAQKQVTDWIAAQLRDWGVATVTEDETP